MLCQVLSSVKPHQAIQLTPSLLVFIRKGLALFHGRVSVSTSLLVLARVSLLVLAPDMPWASVPYLRIYIVRPSIDKHCYSSQSSQQSHF